MAFYQAASGTYLKGVRSEKAELLGFPPFTAGSSLFKLPNAVNEDQPTSSAQDQALRRCLKRIEEKLGWGDAGQWTSNDFEELSHRIQEETSGVVSATTLKRVWGRVAYESSPSRHTLDTLVEFVGYDSWRAWGEAEEEAEGEGEDEEEAEEEAEGEREGEGEAGVEAQRWVSVERKSSRLSFFSPRFRLAAASLVVLAVAVGAWAVLSGSPERDSDRSIVRFTSRAVAEGLPNTVIFEYDVGDVEADSFFIQQSWDASRRVRISPDQRTLTSTYYEPGFYRASLVANDEVLRSHPVHVTTDGWLALVEGDPTPVYLPEANDAGLGYLMASEDMLDERELASTGDLRLVNFYNVRSFEPLHTDDFRFQAVIRHPGANGVDPCKRAEVVVLGEDGALAFLLGIPGCIGDLEAMFGDVHLGGSTNDLSALGIDLSDWQRLEMHVEDRNVRLQVGENEPLTARYTMDIGRVVGLQLRFAGAGAIDHVTLSDVDGRVVYDESF